MGTPEFAVPSLKFLIDSSHEVVGVVTQPDRPKGRNRKMAASPVKIIAQEAGIPIYHPEKINNIKMVNELRKLNPDVIIVVAYGQILSKDILSIPKNGCINVHASLLPKYRGAAPIQWAIIKGETETGITTMLMDEGMDTGDILVQTKVEISANDTAGTLHDKLAEVGAQTLKHTLELMGLKKLKRIPQDHSLASYAPMLRKEDGLINWDKNVMDINNLIRGTNPWPGAYTFIRGMQLKIHESKIFNQTAVDKIPGQVVGFEKGKGILVACKKGILLIKKVQPPGKQEMSAWAYVLGHPIEIGSVLG